MRGRTRRLSPDAHGWRAGAKPVTTVTAGRNARRECRRGCRRRVGTGGDARADDRPRAHIRPRLRCGTDDAPGRAGDPRHHHRVALRQARSGHLAAAAALDALQRGLERILGAVAQRRRAPAGLDCATDGNLYRLSFFTFAQGFNRDPKGNAYLGSYTIFTPLSRRLVLITNIPFVLRNNAVTGLPSRP